VLHGVETPPELRVGVLDLLVASQALDLLDLIDGALLLALELVSDH